MIFVSLAAKFIADYSGEVERFKYWWFYRKFTRKTKFVPYSFRPWDCDMCLSFWIMLLWLILNNVLNTMTFIIPFANASLTVIINSFKKKY